MLEEVLHDLLVGAVSSGVTLLVLHLYRQRMYRARFGWLAGTYVHETVGGDRIGSGETVIAHVGRNLLSTQGARGDGGWSGRLTMAEDAPEFGSGFYQYEDRLDCGRHEVQVLPDRRRIVVRGANTSHDEERRFSVVWRRID